MTPRPLTFDCYGTLIDWETGLATGMRAALAPRRITLDDESLLERYAGYEAALEAGPYRPYRDVLAHSLEAIADGLGVTPTQAELRAFGGSVGDCPGDMSSAPVELTSAIPARVLFGEPAPGTAFPLLELPAI